MARRPTEPSNQRFPSGPTSCANRICSFAYRGVWNGEWTVAARLAHYILYQSSLCSIHFLAFSLARVFGAACDTLTNPSPVPRLGDTSQRATLLGLRRKLGGLVARGLQSHLKKKGGLFFCVAYLCWCGLYGPPPLPPPLRGGNIKMWISCSDVKHRNGIV